jgi:hypothetical protein
MYSRFILLPSVYVAHTFMHSIFFFLNEKEDMASAT